jgi:hypothetical protein
MKAIGSLRRILILLVVMAVITGTVVVAANGNFLHLINPAPEQIAAKFVTALAAHQFGGARSVLSTEQRSEMTLERLRILVASIEARSPGIEQAAGKDSRTYGRTASAFIVVQMKDGSEVPVELTMIRENGIWKVYSFEDILNLAFSHPPLLLLSS